MVSCVWSTGQTSDTIDINQTGQYWVECTDVFGFVSRDTINVSLTTSLTPENTVFCPGSTVDWNPMAIGSGYNYLWSDGSTSQINAIGLEQNFS